MSLLRNFSPGTDPDDDDEQPTTTADGDETAPPDLPQRSGTARYAYAAPTAGTAEPVPGTVVESEVVPDSDPVDEPEAAAEPSYPAEPAVAAGPSSAEEPAYAAEPDDVKEPSDMEEPGYAAAPAYAQDTVPAPVAETAAPETTPSPTFQPNPVPVPSPRTGENEAPGQTPGMPGPDFAAPLLGNAAELRARWKEVQGDFVDDPQAAVSDAADLVGQTAEALVGALRQRQRQLREAWDRNAADGSPGGQSAAMAGAPDTEQLRLTMQRYRALFNQLCRPS